jgi:hypothetical protein
MAYFKPPEKRLPRQRIPWSSKYRRPGTVTRHLTVSRRCAVVGRGQTEEKVAFLCARVPAAGFPGRRL